MLPFSSFLFDIEPYVERLRFTQTTPLQRLALSSLIFLESLQCPPDLLLSRSLLLESVNYISYWNPRFGSLHPGQQLLPHKLSYFLPW